MISASNLFSFLAVAMWPHFNSGTVHNLPVCAGSHSFSRQHLLNEQFAQAANSGNLSRMKRLLTLGANVDSTQQNSWTALMLAVQNDDVPVVQYLLAHGANPNRHTHYYNDYWPLQLAAEEGNIPIAKALLHHGANINDEDTAGNTALMTAAEDSNMLPVQAYRMVKFLIRNGAQVNAKNRFGETPLSIAISTRKSVPQFSVAVKFLKDAGGRE